VIITATPDLSSLKNAKALLDHMGNLRPNDAAPHLVLNQIAMPKRAEIKPAAFAKALGVTSMTEIAFDPSSFSKASIAGQLLVEHNPKTAASRKFGDLVRTIAPSARLTRQPIGLARLWSR
jgi:pilus assembly protein CpaE